MNEKLKELNLKFVELLNRNIKELSSKDYALALGFIEVYQEIGKKLELFIKYHQEHKCLDEVLCEECILYKFCIPDKFEKVLE